MTNTSMLRTAAAAVVLAAPTLAAAQTPPTSNDPFQTSRIEQESAQVAQPSSAASVSVAGAESPGEEPKLADIKSGRLARYGITAGVALAAHFPLSGEQKQIGTGALPYIEILPLIWLIHGDISRAYCVAQLTDGATAQDIADGVALERTRKASDAMSEASLSRQDRAKQVVKETGWELGTPASGCAYSWFGVYVGLPAEFDANSTINHSLEKARDFKPLGSFGLTFSPTSLIRLLVGFTLSNVEDDAEKNQTTGSLSVSLGGNLDIAGALIP